MAATETPPNPRSGDDPTSILAELVKQLEASEAFNHPVNSPAANTLYTTSFRSIIDSGEGMKFVRDASALTNARPHKKRLGSQPAKPRKTRTKEKYAREEDSSHSFCRRFPCPTSSTILSQLGN